MPQIWLPVKAPLVKFKESLEDTFPYEAALVI